MFCSAFVVAAALSVPAPAAAQCLLCPASPIVETSPPTEARSATPLVVEVSSGLDFNRVALSANGGGSVEIDPVARSRSVRGLIDLSGMVMTAGVTVRGEAGRAVRISLPGNVALQAANGGNARISRLVTDLASAPRLGPDGVLRFTLGGRLDVTDDMAGSYQGRIPITVDYE